MRFQSINKFDFINPVHFRTRIPYLNFAANIYGFFQPNFSGYINSRKLIEAQSKIAGDLGCIVIRDGVLTLSQNAETHLYQIQTMSGEFLFAKNVILATGKDMNLGKLNRGPDKFGESAKNNNQSSYPIETNNEQEGLYLE